MRWRKRWNLPLMATMIFSLTFTVGLAIGWKIVFQRDAQAATPPAEISRGTSVHDRLPILDAPACCPLDN